MILDNTIDQNTARYWCAFADIATSQKKQQDKQVTEEIGTLAILGGALTAVSVISMLTPFAKNMYNKILSHRSSVIAITEFEADEKSYRAFFDMKKRSWKLVSTFKVSANESLQFFQTNFFKAFNQRCQQILSPILDNKNEILGNLEQIEDKKVQRLTKMILDNEQVIRNYMFSSKIST